MYNKRVYPSNTTPSRSSHCVILMCKCCGCRWFRRTTKDNRPWGRNWEAQLYNLVMIIDSFVVKKWYFHWCVGLSIRLVFTSQSKRVGLRTTNIIYPLGVVSAKNDLIFKWELFQLLRLWALTVSHVGACATTVASGGCGGSGITTMVWHPLCSSTISAIHCDHQVPSWVVIVDVNHMNLL